MPSISSDGRDIDAGQVPNPRAEFIASLERRTDDARELTIALEQTPSVLARDELRRRLHALRSGARILRLNAMAVSLDEALGVLERSSRGVDLRREDVAFVRQVLDDVPALAWGESQMQGAASETPVPPKGSEPERVSVLVVGDEALAEELVDGSSDGSRARAGDSSVAPPYLAARAFQSRVFECERTDTVDKALDLARAYAPDLLIIHADLSGATELVEALANDSLTEPIPILVVGAFAQPEASASFVALGVAKTLARPWSLGALRAACSDVLDVREGRTMRVTLGEPTVEQLADRLSRELREALVGGIDRPARSFRVPLGEGTEVMGALWGAISRVQEIVTRRTDGAVQYKGSAPEGTIAFAPRIHVDVAASERLAVRTRGAASDVALEGRHVVVADDDPGVTWFIADLLRNAGCEVHEALDGSAAFEFAIRIQPDLVVADILMPGMDGFALSRALHRDIALRDTPVILLSWKEDLLQRVRELGARAAAYMRKESDSRSILARVREVLRPRARVEARLKTGGEVRGRLDELTPRLLLQMVCTLRENARVSVRDASDLYEVEIRDGAPRKITRTDSDGHFVRGQRALAALAGIGAGRFTVVSSREPVRGELSGTLFEQLATPIAYARGALLASTGASTIDVERIGLDPEIATHYLRVTPEPAKSLIVRLSAGESPRQMILRGQIAPSLLDDVLAELAARGAIAFVQGLGGEDRLGPAVEAAHATLRGSLAGTGEDSTTGAPRPEEASVAVVSPIAVPLRAEPVDSIGESQGAGPSAPPPSPDVSTAPSSLEDAVVRQISERSPAPAVVTARPPIVEPSALRRRSSTPPSRSYLTQKVVEREQQASNEMNEVEVEIDVQIPANPVSLSDSMSTPPLQSHRRTAIVLGVLLICAAAAAVAWMFGTGIYRP